ncbi:hypothetical protein ACFUEN_08810 [Streptomyces griseorubiginosus]|jgi:vacuolar-type H+-ATPase subunit E/Vma4|uniref:hypothetical protein n=1 Tax=Streptomyces griseorubiginosus TaxID=67304 RepID=UPI00363F1F18
MRTSLTAEAEEALAPVRARLLADARAAAEAALVAAAEDADAMSEDAEARAAAILAEAREQGAADAESARRTVRAQARRAARARDLATRRQCWEELRRQVVRGVEDLSRTEAYPSLRARLTLQARRLLGPDARITEVPGGGVIGETSDRRVDLSLAAFAHHALDRHGAELEELWTP